nr:annexin A7-like [Dermacentor andersoni]
MLYVQVLLLWLVGDAFAQHHNQPARAAQQGFDYRNYLAAVAPYAGGYDAYASTPAQYSFGYDTPGEYTDRQFNTGQGGSNVANSGLYGHPGADAMYRQMNYVGAPQGFRPTVGSMVTNEKGPTPGVSGNAVLSAPPIGLPVPTGSAQNSAAAAYGARAAVPDAGDYSRYGRPAPDPYALAAGAFEYAPYGRYGYGFNEAALGGQAYGSFAPYGPGGYAAGYNPGADAASTGYANPPSAHRGYRRR